MWNTSETCKRSFIGAFLIPVNATDTEKNSGWESKSSNVFVSLRIISNFGSILNEMGKKIENYSILFCSKLAIETLEQGVKYVQS